MTDSNEKLQSRAKKWLERVEEGKRDFEAYERGLNIVSDFVLPEEARRERPTLQRILASEEVTAAYFQGRNIIPRRPPDKGNLLATLAFQLDQKLCGDLKVVREVTSPSAVIGKKNNDLVRTLRDVGLTDDNPSTRDTLSLVSGTTLTTAYRIEQFKPLKERIKPRVEGKTVGLVQKKVNNPQNAKSEDQEEHPEADFLSKLLKKTEHFRGLADRASEITGRLATRLFGEEEAERVRDIWSGLIFLITSAIPTEEQDKIQALVARRLVNRNWLAAENQLARTVAVHPDALSPFAAERIRNLRIPTAFNPDPDPRQNLINVFKTIGTTAEQKRDALKTWVDSKKPPEVFGKTREGLEVRIGGGEKAWNRYASMGSNIINVEVEADKEAKCSKRTQVKGGARTQWHPMHPDLFEKRLRDGDIVLDDLPTERIR